MSQAPINPWTRSKRDDRQLGLARGATTSRCCVSKSKTTPGARNHLRNSIKYGFVYLEGNRRFALRLCSFAVVHRSRELERLKLPVASYWYTYGGRRGDEPRGRSAGNSRILAGKRTRNACARSRSFRATGDARSAGLSRLVPVAGRSTAGGGLALVDQRILTVVWWGIAVRPFAARSVPARYTRGTLR
jgi:hypothetical protein